MNLHANPGSCSFVTQLRCLFSRVQCANATFMATNQQPQREVQAHRHDRSYKTEAFEAREANPSAASRDHDATVAVGGGIRSL